MFGLVSFHFSLRNVPTVGGKTVPSLLQEVKIAEILVDVLRNRPTATSNQRLWAADYLTAIGLIATNAIAALQQTTNDADRFVQSMARWSLGQLTVCPSEPQPRSLATLDDVSMPAKGP